ncbi:hypothetical protein [Bergeyella zoohelcum]|uniref:Uncharacterized protein n=1 Tax=Bergeyella zoohelcum TaxID=1015 RepID=A0A7Z8YNL4_9FLAO|nr:hypothetical protein [Bergeyella zoohelcum]VDH04359.1 Uncharacterised protein [Bergeyella zoohelcum]
MKKFNHHTLPIQFTMTNGIVMNTICRGTICSLMIMGTMFIHTLI